MVRQEEEPGGLRWKHHPLRLKTWEVGSEEMVSQTRPGVLQPLREVLGALEGARVGVP